MMDPVFRIEFKVTEAALDANGHVNNVAYVQWMQDAAIRHSETSGCSQLTRDAGATWVARSHHIEYLRPGFAGDLLTIHTWVADFRKVRSRRQYRILRAADQTVLAEGETDWVFVDLKSGRPRAIPLEIQQVFQVVGPSLKTAG